MPKPIVDKLQHEISNIYADPVIFQKLDKAGLFPTDSKSSTEFSNFIGSEKVRWGEVIKEHGGAKLLN
jgi:tripartite-type tricarboxylate transporter receptor subunit TctC